MGVFTGSDINAMLIFTVTAESNGSGGTAFTTNTLNAKGCAITGAVVNEGCFIKVPVSYDYPLAKQNQAPFCTPFITDPAVGLGPFSPALVASDDGTSICIAIDQSALPPAAPVTIEFHFAMLQLSTT